MAKNAKVEERGEDRKGVAARELATLQASSLGYEDGLDVGLGIGYAETRVGLGGSLADLLDDPDGGEE